MILHLENIQLLLVNSRFTLFDNQGHHAKYIAVDSPEFVLFVGTKVANHISNYKKDFKYINEYLYNKKIYYRYVTEQYTDEFPVGTEAIA